MALLPGIHGPRDLDSLNPDELRQLAAEVRSFLVENVARTGGHLGPNLGVVELTIALHKVFDSPADPIIFDTGHQSYVHKILTGRQDFENLRSRGGLAGYPQRSESEHDVVESSHASSSLSWADGVSRAFSRTGRRDRHVIAVVGDGALTGGMTWEALNNISDDNDRLRVTHAHVGLHGERRVCIAQRQHAADLALTLQRLRLVLALDGPSEHIVLRNRRAFRQRGSAGNFRIRHRLAQRVDQHFQISLQGLVCKSYPAFVEADLVDVEHPL